MLELINWKMSKKFTSLFEMKTLVNELHCYKTFVGEYLKKIIKIKWESCFKIWNFKSTQDTSNTSSTISLASYETKDTPLSSEASPFRIQMNYSMPFISYNQNIRNKVLKTEQIIIFFIKYL